MKNSVKLACIAGVLMLLLVLSSVGQSTPAPDVISGSRQNYSIALSGHNFGTGLCGGNG